MRALAAHGPPPRRRRWWLLALVLAAVVVAGGVAGFVLSTKATGGPVRATSPTAGKDGGNGATAPGRKGHGGTANPAGGAGFSIVGTEPRSGATGVASDATLTVKLSQPLRAGGPSPTLDPPVAGTWVRAGRATLRFEPSAPFVPGQTETLVVPGGAGGLRDTAGAVLADSTTATFTIASGSTLRLQQLLAELGYLPVSFTQQGNPPPQQMALDQPGTFAWRWSTLPAELVASWIAGSPNVVTQGAIMTFENQHGLKVDGLAGPQVWRVLLQAVASSSADQAPYTYAYVSKNVPQTLTVYVNGNPQFANIPVNTGLPGADTADGTYPVFEHVPSSEMKGTNPDGTTYDDPNVPWASYFNGGDALHGFVRAQYGFPQSNGCVEMSIANAQMTWPYTPIGTLVTVVGPPVT